ncbi:hypothetical protein [Aneurinibacillus aneurinilyticus]|uniref:Uncharacterized protein n=2 Tax=Aneurinibacillus aneurinilyticus TaxID=1391 RepID=A0A848D4Y9_ANEAE|nr:hypothetical protein [Aneurinibacillus aneurinilyticus]ERI06830.1 hypothetical protein HMPREF0083_05095 [Aneurinibacillus aneurinilyticus ATCC 12856]MED0705509.1 hypothetical protein [Aneurinibacillus aneurinilyticus]MED0722950.1 hypothetical protein [Aneurinibacillus aneurinilyticus]MED0732356.1 hypothetical protein [Aneurinibacillus aneurinilyticus]MED0740955.1 hypothetical protein [Aneurinibacillus aneurinilyticus]
MGFKDAVIAILSLADPDMLRENSRSWQIDGKQYAKRDAGPNMRMKMTCGYGENVEKYFTEQKQPSLQHLVITMPHPKTEWEECVRNHQERDRPRWKQRKQNMKKGERK